MRVALLLPDEPDTGWINRVNSLAAMLTEDPDWTVVIGLPDGPRWSRRADRLNSSSAVTVRRIAWQSHSSATLQQIFGGTCVPTQGVSEAVVPHDWGWTCRDCDAWLLCADARLGAVAALKPTLVYCRGLEQRYVPEIFATSIKDPLWERQISAFLAWRRAPSVAIANPANAADIVSYAGVRREKLRILPPIPFPSSEAPAREGRPPHVLWLTGSETQHDHVTSVEALRLWRKSGSTRPVVAGTTERELPMVVTEMSDQKFWAGSGGSEAMLRAIPDEATVVFSDAIADGEAEAALMAAASGRVYVGPETPQARWVRDQLGAAAVLYSAGDAGAACRALERACGLEMPRPLHLPSSGNAWREQIQALIGKPE